jgi:hypothetical protein
MSDIHLVNDRMLFQKINKNNIIPTDVSLDYAKDVFRSKTFQYYFINVSVIIVIMLICYLLYCLALDKQYEKYYEFVRTYYDNDNYLITTNIRPYNS